MRETLRVIFEDASSRQFRIANDFFAILTILSIVGIALETVQGFKYSEALLWIEYGTVFFFSLEYIGRIIAAQKPLKYIFSFFGIIDLLAILPSILTLGNLSLLKSARVIRLMRLLRMLRLVKVVRAQKMRHVDDYDQHTSLLLLNIQIYFTTLFAAILFSGSLIWAVEGYRDVFTNIPVAMLWSTKVLLGGTPQAEVLTYGGEMVVIFTRFLGLILFGLLINIVGGSVKKLLLGSKKEEEANNG